MSVDLLPRSGSDGSFGDLIEIDFAFLQWEPFTDEDITVQVGKFASAFGFEYRREESNARMGITPSLIARYVSGHPIGIKARGQWFDKSLVAHLALINGSSNLETFPFGEELDSNDAKSLSGRLSFDFSRWVTGADNLTLGLSGEIGAQVRQPDNGVYQRQAGVDLEFETGDLEILVEALLGKAPGNGETEAPELDFRGAYIQGAYRVNEWLTPYARGDWRRATHVDPARRFAYVVAESRFTVGLRFDLSPRILLKAEYVHIMELGPVPDIRNDVFAASLVLVF